MNIVDRHGYHPSLDAAIFTYEDLGVFRITSVIFEPETARNHSLATAITQARRGLLTSFPSPTLPPAIALKLANLEQVAGISHPHFLKHISE